MYEKLGWRQELESIENRSIGCKETVHRGKGESG